MSTFIRYELGGNVKSYVTIARSKHDLNHDNVTPFTSYMDGYPHLNMRNLNAM